MEKKIHNLPIVAFVVVYFLNIQINAQTSWEFTDAASGTDIWVPTNFTTSQGKHLATYTTTGTADPELNTNTASFSLTTGTDATIVTSRRLLGITMRVSIGGPDYIRVSHPDDTNNDGSRHITNLQIAADGKWRTYIVDLGSQAAYRTDWGNGIADGGTATDGVEKDIKITFRTYNAANPAGDAFTISGAKIEIDRIEFANNAWINDSSNTASNDNWGNNGNWYITPGPNQNQPQNSDLDIVIPTGDDTQNPNLNVNLTDAKYHTLHVGAGAKLTMTNGGKNIQNEALILSPGASFAHDSGSNFSSLGTVTVKVDIPDDGWHLITSPLNVEQYDDTWVSNNGIDSGTGNNRGISTYNNATGNWEYFQASGTSTNFTIGVGYALKRSEKGLYVFEGDAFVNAATISPAISQGTSTNWNLVGSPHTAHLSAATFISDNIAILPPESQAIYVWNGTSYTSLTTGDLAVGQAFFINNNSGASNIAFNTASTSTDANNSAIFYKNNDTRIKLTITSDDKSITTFLNYSVNDTKGLNPGRDISLFDGVATDFTIYTHLLEDNTGINFERQALPNKNLESLVIPIGVKASAGKEITISAEALNLPPGLKVILEDRISNTFTRLDKANNNYKITVDNALDGVGRFYLHTRGSALSIENSSELTGVSIFKTNNSTLRISGLREGKASISLFNIQGKEVFTTKFNARNVSDISLPKLSTGIYLAKLKLEKENLTRKLILE